MIKFDLYDTIVKTIIKDPNDRQDLRVFIDVGLKVGMIGIWHLYLFEESRLSVPALVTCILIWPIYHIYVIAFEINKSNDKLYLIDRKKVFRVFDQIQNFILLIGFVVLVYRDRYRTTFHLATLYVLLIDLGAFVLQILISCCVKEDPSHNYLPTQTSDQNAKQQNENKIESDTSGIICFSTFFVMAAIGANFLAIYLMHIFGFFDSKSLNIAIVVTSQVVGNVIVVYIGFKILFKSPCGTGSFCKLISMLLQGLVCGVTSILYGLLFGIIIILAFFVFFCCPQKERQCFEDTFYKPYINWLQNI